MADETKGQNNDLLSNAQLDQIESEVMRRLAERAIQYRQDVEAELKQVRTVQRSRVVGDDKAEAHDRSSSSYELLPREQPGPTKGGETYRFDKDPHDKDPHDKDPGDFSRENFSRENFSRQG